MADNRPVPWPWSLDELWRDDKHQAVQKRTAGTDGNPDFMTVQFEGAVRVFERKCGGTEWTEVPAL